MLTRKFLTANASSCVAAKFLSNMSLLAKRKHCLSFPDLTRIHSTSISQIKHPAKTTQDSKGEPITWLQLSVVMVIRSSSSSSRWTNNWKSSYKIFELENIKSKLESLFTRRWWERWSCSPSSAPQKVTVQSKLSNCWSRRLVSCFYSTAWQTDSTCLATLLACVATSCNCFQTRDPVMWGSSAVWEVLLFGDDGSVRTHEQVPMSLSRNDLKPKWEVHQHLTGIPGRRELFWGHLGGPPEPRVSCCHHDLMMGTS